MCQRDGPVARRALEVLWQTRDGLSELGTAHCASSRVVRYSDVAQETGSGGPRAGGHPHLDSLAASCQTVTRTTLTAGQEDRSALLSVIAELARQAEEPLALALAEPARLEGTSWSTWRRWRSLTPGARRDREVVTA